MKILINTEIIKSLNPCKDRFQNWLEEYNTWNGDIQEFLLLENITHQDKLWVSLRLIPRILVETFSLDCVISAAASAAYSADAAASAASAAYAAAYAADAAYAAASAAYADAAADAAAAASAAAASAASAAAAAAAAYAAAAAERERQLCVIEYLITNYKPQGKL
jgi:hypothetical protein